MLKVLSRFVSHFSTPLRSFISRNQNLSPYLIEQARNPELETKDFSLLIPSLNSMSNESLLKTCKDFSSYSRLLVSDMGFSQSCLSELHSRMTSKKISVLEFCEMAKNLSQNHLTRREVTQIFKKTIYSGYLNMDELAQLINLAFFNFRVRDLRLFKEAADLMELRVSQSYSAKSIIDCVQVLTRIGNISKTSERILNKFLIFLSTKIEMDPLNDSIRIFEIINECEVIQRNFQQLSFKNIFNLPPETFQMMSTQKFMHLNYNIAEILKKKQSYINFSLKKYIYSNISEKITQNDFNWLNLGVTVESLATICGQLPEDFVKMVENYLKNSRNINFSHVLATINIYHMNKNENFLEFTIDHEISLRNQPFSEILKIFNCTRNVKSMYTRYLKFISKASEKTLKFKTQSEDLYEILDILQNFENFGMFKRPLIIMADEVDKCIENLSNFKHLLDKYSYFSILVRYFKPLASSMENLLLEQIKTLSNHDLTDFLTNGKYFHQRAIVFILKNSNLTDDQKLFALLSNISESNTLIDIVESSKILNDLNGNVFDADFFEFESEIFFKILNSKEADKYFKPFFGALLNHIKTLPDTELKSVKVLNTLKWLKLFEKEDEELIEKVLKLNQEIALNEIESYLFLCSSVKDEELKEFINDYLLTEVSDKQLNYIWPRLDYKECSLMIQAIASLKWISPQMEEKIINYFTEKFGKLYIFHVEDMFELLTDFKIKTYKNNEKFIEHIFDQANKMAKKDDTFITPKFLVNYCQSFCKFPIKNQSLYKTIFVEIGKNYLKLNLESKVSILKSLALRGICNKEIFRRVLTDIITPDIIIRDYHIDAIVSACDVNFESNPSCIELFNMAKELFSPNKKVVLDTKIKILYMHAKMGSFFEYQEVNEDSINSIIYSQTTQKFFSVLLYYKSIGIDIIDQKIVNKFCFELDQLGIWGLDLNSVSEIRKNLEKDFCVEEMVDFFGLQVPFVKKGTNTLIFPKNTQTCTFDLSEFKGDFNLIFLAFEQLGYEVLAYETLNKGYKLSPIFKSI